MPLNAFVGLGPVGKPTAFPFQMLLWGWPLETGALLFLRALSRAGSCGNWDAGLPLNAFVGLVLWAHFFLLNVFVGAL